MRLVAAVIKAVQKIDSNGRTDMVTARDKGAKINREWIHTYGNCESLEEVVKISRQKTNLTLNPAYESMAKDEAQRKRRDELTDKYNREPAGACVWPGC